MSKGRRSPNHVIWASARSFVRDNLPELDEARTPVSAPRRFSQTSVRVAGFELADLAARAAQVARKSLRFGKGEAFRDIKPMFDQILA